MTTAAGQVDRYTTWSQDTAISSIDPMFSWLVPTFFGITKNFDGEFVEHDIVEHGRRIAPFVSPLGIGKPTRQTGYRTFQIKPAYIKLLDTVRPTQGFTRMPGEPYGGNLTPAERLARQVAEKMALHREMIEVRWEAMAAEVLFNAQLTITDDGYPTALVDFERDPNLSMTVGTVWSNTASDPMSDIQTMADRINTSSRGSVPDTLVCRTGIYDNLMKNIKFRDSLNKESNLSKNKDAGFEATGLRAADKKPQFRGKLGGQYDLWTYDGYYEDDSGVTKAFVPATKVLVCGGQSIDGRRYHGAIQDMDAGMAALDVFVKTRNQWNPSGVEVLTQSAPMLGMRRPNASGVLTVL